MPVERRQPLRIAVTGRMFRPFELPRVSVFVRRQVAFEIDDLGHGFSAGS